MNKKCNKECPKGGDCLRQVRGTKEGALHVTNHFSCLMVQKFIFDNVGKIKVKHDANYKGRAST